jgi:hypothetical protein
VVQVTADSGSGATLGSFESDIYALGAVRTSRESSR